MCPVPGGTVAQAVAPTIYGLERPRGHGFEYDPLSFPDPIPHLFSPSHFLSKPSLSYLNKATQKPKNKSKKKKNVPCAFQNIAFFRNTRNKVLLICIDVVVLY